MRTRFCVGRWFVGICAVAILALGASAPAANAWGCKGHQTVALIAEKHLTPEAKQFVDSLLSANPIDPSLKRWCGNATSDLMVDASTWPDDVRRDRKSTRLNSSHPSISYAVFCLKKKKKINHR